MTIYIFSGPTIPEADARRLLDAVYLPPVSQGDIVSLLRFKPQVIGIIDGYFDNVPAVWHKEILLALSQGVHVFGAASMGALRAAELHPFGMVGIGEIFEWYRDGVIEADDEVAVRHAPAELGYRPLNEALVNIRKTLALAYDKQIISAAVQEKIRVIGQQIPYWERSYDRLFVEAEQSGVPVDVLGKLQQFVDQQAVNLKQNDAEALLRHIAQLPSRLTPHTTSFELQKTVYLSRLIDRDRTIYQTGEVQLRAEDLINHARVERPDFMALKERASISGLLLDMAGQYGLVVTEEELLTEKQMLGVETAEQIEQWLARNHMTADELAQLVNECALIRKMEAIYTRRVNNQALLRQLRVEGLYEAVMQSAVDQKRTFLDGYRPPEDAAEALLAAYFARRQQEMPEDIHAYAAALGFDSHASFMLEIEKNFYYHQQKGKADT